MELVHVPTTRDSMRSGFRSPLVLVGPNLAVLGAGGLYIRAIVMTIRCHAPSQVATIHGGGKAHQNAIIRYKMHALSMLREYWTAVQACLH